MTEKRCITYEEIEKLLDFITPQKGIPPETAMSHVEINKNKFRKQLEHKMIYPEILPKLRMHFEKMYEETKVQAGENVGILTAQSFGQLQTQNTLNSFHKAGLAEKTVITGVSRFSELLSATKAQKGISCIIPFKSHNDSIQNLRKSIGSSLVELNLTNLSDTIRVYMDKKPEDWYESFRLLYNNNFCSYRYCVSIKLKQKLIYEYSIELEHIARRIEEEYSDLFCVFSTLHECKIDVYVDVSNINFPEDKLLYVTKDNMVDIYLEDVVIPNLKKIHLFGIEGISNIFYCTEKTNVWHIETYGTNFQEILARPDVDMPNVMTTDMWEIYNTLGIEATRQYLIKELCSIMAGINICHCKLLVDKMTHNGTITSISRYAMRGEGSGALSKASFEETLDNLLNAAVNGEKECTDGVSAGIICGKLGKFGSGMCELKIDVAKLLGKPLILEKYVCEG